MHKDFLVVGDPHAFLAKAPLIYSFCYDTGRREYEKIGPGEAVLTTRDATTFRAPDCLTVIGWHIRALEMCGARWKHRSTPFVQHHARDFAATAMPGPDAFQYRKWGRVYFAGLQI